MKKIIAIVSISLALSVFYTPPAMAGTEEPKSIKKASKLKAGEGAARLSVRSQKQGTQTLFVYFVKLNADGSESDYVARFERGAGVPIFGSNMIDVHDEYYRMEEGRYRLLAFTIACEQIPPPGTVCMFGFGTPLPTGTYGAGAPSFEVKAGQLSDFGDFIIERTDLPATADVHPAEAQKDSAKWEARWRPITAPISKKFAELPVLPAANIPDEYKSRITCEERPDGITLYIPYKC